MLKTALLILTMAQGDATRVTLSEAEIHRYRVEVPNGNGYRIAPLAKDETCTPDLAADPAVYCAQSGQGVLTDG